MEFLGAEVEFRKKAKKLGSALELILRKLIEYEGPHKSLAREYIGELSGPVSIFQNGMSEKSRIVAAEAISNIVLVLNSLSAAVTKGEVQFKIDEPLEIVNSLYTIFRESKYRDCNL